MAALALILPSLELRVETEGCDSPAGQTERKPRAPSGTTVRFREYARALAGMPQGLAGTMKSRGAAAARLGPPTGPAGVRVAPIAPGTPATQRHAPWAAAGTPARPTGQC